MKNSFKIFLGTLLIGFAFPSLAQNGTTSSCVESTARDVQVGLTVRINNDITYFKLLIQNESKDGVYSMVRTYADGSFEYVDHKNAVPNEINQPLLYCFKDQAIPNKDFTYVLYRISSETEVVGKWNYSADKNAITTESSSSDDLVTSLK